MTEMNCVRPSGNCPWTCDGYVFTCPIPESEAIDKELWIKVEQSGDL